MKIIFWTWFNLRKEKAQKAHMKKTSGEKGREREVPKRKSNIMSRQTLTRNTNQEVCRESILRKPLQAARIKKCVEKVL